MKKFLFTIILFFIGYTFALDQFQIDYLKSLNIPANVIEQILPQKQVSRYDATKILNYALCFDCIFPPEKIKNSFNYGWFNKFIQQPNFYLNDITPQDPYYYCIVSLASKDYIH